MGVDLEWRTVGAKLMSAYKMPLIFIWHQTRDAEYCREQSPGSPRNALRFLESN
jgi:hypothetical protein